MADTLLINRARTAFGALGSGLKDTTAKELGVAATKGAERSGIEPSRVDNVVMGNVIQSYSGPPYLDCHVALDADIR